MDIRGSWKFDHIEWRPPYWKFGVFLGWTTFNNPLTGIHLSCSGAKKVPLFFIYYIVLRSISSNYKKLKITKLLNWKDRWNYWSIQCITKQSTINVIQQSISIYKSRGAGEVLWLNINRLFFKYSDRKCRGPTWFVSIMYLSSTHGRSE
jgi:hypothetical protein